jgi:hypothetical protein
VDDVVSAAFEQPLSGPAVRDVWDVCAPRLAPALEGDELGPLLESLEEVARNAALTGARDIGDLLDGFAEGCLAVRRLVGARSGPGAGGVLARLAIVERDGAARLAAGYAAGLEETIGRLRHQTEECSPEDPASGAMRVAETMQLLAVEVDRCRRTALSLGVLGLALGDEPRPVACVRTDGPDLLHVVAGALRGNVRRYDGVGRTADGDFLVVIPDVSRRSLAAIAERLRREVVVELGRGRGCVVALAHYDFVDVSAAEVMAAVQRRVATACAGRESVA